MPDRGPPIKQANHRDFAPTPQAIRMGLRFRKSQARLLRDLADRARRKELGEAVAVFAQAAEAARLGEPLEVLCIQPLEAVIMAQGYSRYGVVPPTVEQLRDA